MKCLGFAYSAIALALATVVKSEFIYSCTEKKTIAMTFDDGPFQYTQQLVDYFVDEHPDIKVTFFQVGKFHYPFAIDTEEYQQAMKKAHDNGLQIPSHTFGHKVSDDLKEFKESLDTMDDFIEKVTGDRPRYFRAPKGHCGKECQSALDEWDYKLIQWDSDTNDWDLETSGTAEQRIEDSINFLKKVFAEEKDSYLILMHDTENYTVSDIAPWIVEKSGMKEKGYKFVTVAECLGDKNGMYRSGKTYGNDAPVVQGNSTTANNATINNATINNATITKDGNAQNLNTSDGLLSKPITLLPYLCLGLMSTLLYSML